MQKHHAMPDFRCRSTCQHKECQKHSPLGIIDTHEQCQCLGQVNASSLFLENVLDLANTLAQVMILCGIHECKAKSTIDISTYAFLHYDLVCYCLDTVPRKRMRKEDIFHELGKRCLMNRVEAHMAYTVMKRGFKAFYYKPTDTIPSGENDVNTNSMEECLYVHAAKRTAESFGRYDGLSCEEQRGIEAKIKVAYKKFYDRMKKRMSQPPGEDCNCCFCAKKRGHLVYGKEPPCEGDGGKKKKEHVCPYCCRKKDPRKLVHPGRVLAKCPNCHRALKYCICLKFKTAHCDYIKSIWERPDWQEYYAKHIENPDEKDECDCNEWVDPSWVRTILAAESACDDWIDPDHVKKLMKINN